MKKNQFWGLALAASIAFSSTSCKKDEFLDVNQNPNSPLVVGMPVLLTGALLTTGFANANDLGRVTSLLVQYQAGINNQPATYDVYNIRGSFDNQWNGELYGGSLVNTKQLIDLANQKNSPAYGGIGKLLQAYSFALTTDLYGDVPYSQALQGLGNLAPRFDKQEDIYKGNSAKGIQSLLDLVKSGLADLDKPSALKPSLADDPVYGGDLNKWKQMGNTLLLKLANTISKKEPALAGSIISQAAAGAITSNANDFQIPFGTATTNQNPLYQYNFATRPDDQMLSRRLLDSMSVRRDPRLPLYFNITASNTASTTTPLGIFTGFENGAANDFQIPFGTATTNQNPLYQYNFATRPDDQMLSQRLLDSMSVRRDPRLPLYFNITASNTASTNTPLGIFTGYQNGSPSAVPARANRSRYNVYLRGTLGEAPVRLLTNFQRLFILAESAVQGLPGFTLPAGITAQSLYQSAIRASMTKAGVADADVTAYFVANPRVALLSTDATLAQNQIITQKWIAWVGNGYEAYNDYRRTGFPRLSVVQNAAGDDPSIIPRRIPYPNSELNSNTNAEGLDKTIRTSAPVWWAQ